MRITIDTKEDSQDEIRKIIKMLSSLIGEKEIISNQGDIFTDDSSQQSTDVFNMFNDPKSKNDKKKQKEETENIDIDIPGLEEYD